MPDPLTASTIQAARTNAGLSQLELAAALIDASPAEVERIKDWYAVYRALQKWEQGTATPDRRNTNRLRSLLTIGD